MEITGGEAMELKWGQRISRAKEMRKTKKERRKESGKKEKKKKVVENSCSAWLCKLDPWNLTASSKLWLTA